VEALLVGMMPRLGSPGEFGIRCEESRASTAGDGGEMQRGVTEDRTGVRKDVASCGSGESAWE
jgi:hypothetical protein